MKRTILTACTILFFFVACKKDNDAGGTNVQKMSGEWWVIISVDNSPIDPRYFKILTYNTADNVSNKMWVDDHQNIWPFKFKVDVDPTSQSFSASGGSQSEYTNIMVKVNQGKVLTDVSKGPVSKAVTDSIYFEAEFSDDPGTTYQFAGYRRTRFAEDDH